MPKKHSKKQAKDIKWTNQLNLGNFKKSKYIYTTLSSESEEKLDDETAQKGQKTVKPSNAKSKFIVRY